MTDRELMQQALEALEASMPVVISPQSHEALCAALRERLARQEQPDAHLFYAPGDVLICKESGERVVVKHGNTGPLQLASGKITLDWGDTYGEFTLEQIMDGFIREVPARQEREPVAWGIFDSAGQIDWATKYPFVSDSGWPKSVPLYTTPQTAQQPLTDEQIEDEWERITGHSIFGGNRAEGRTMYISADEVIEFARAAITEFCRINGLLLAAPGITGEKK